MRVGGFEPSSQKGLEGLIADIFMGLTSLAWGLAGVDGGHCARDGARLGQAGFAGSLVAVLVCARDPADGVVVDDRHGGSQRVLGLGGVRRAGRDQGLSVAWGHGVVAGAGAAMARQLAAVAVPGRRDDRPGLRGMLGRGSHSP